MIIWKKEKEDYKIIKDISIKTYENESMEEYILYLYEEYFAKLPIEQNLLICSIVKKHLSKNYNHIYTELYYVNISTLFVIEIIKSFSNFQNNKIYGYIDNLLSIYLEKFKKDNEDKKMSINKNKNLFW